MKVHLKKNGWILFWDFSSKFTSFWKHKKLKNTEKKELNCFTFGSLECTMLLKEKNLTKFVIIPFSLQSTKSRTFLCYRNVVFHYKWKQETVYLIRHITVHFTPDFAWVPPPNVNSTFYRGCVTPCPPPSGVFIYQRIYPRAHILCAAGSITWIFRPQNLTCCEA